MSTPFHLVICNQLRVGGRGTADGVDCRSATTHTVATNRDVQRGVQSAGTDRAASRHVFSLLRAVTRYIIVGGLVCNPQPIEKHARVACLHRTGHVVRIGTRLVSAIIGGSRDI